MQATIVLQTYYHSEMDFSKYNTYTAHSHVQSGQNSDNIKY